MSERMPDFSMPSDDEVARQRAAAEDAAREAAMRAELGLDGDPPARRGAEVERALGDDPDDEVLAPAAAATARAEGSASRRRHVLAIARNPIATFLAGAALVAAAFVAVPAIQRQTEAGSLLELEGVVDAYVTALETGDLQAASRMAPSTSDYADDALLATVVPASLPSIACDEAEVVDDRATVDCDVAVPDRQEPVERMRMQAVRDGSWRIETGLAVAAAPIVQLARIETIGGVALPQDDGPVAGRVWLFPGTYELVVTSSPRLEWDVATLSVGGSGFSYGGGVRPGDAMLEELETAALDYVVACAETAAAGCPAVAPLGPGERFETVVDGLSAFIGERDLVVGVLVRRVGGAPDQWGIDVRAVFADDLRSYVVVPSVPAF